MCGRAVSLESCKIDEHGLAVHEECFVAKIVSKAGPNPEVSGLGKKVRCSSLPARGKYGLLNFRICLPPDHSEATHRGGHFE